jgi:hypothetical protein
MMEQRFTGAAARIARFGPRLAAAPAPRAGAPHRHVQRHDEAAPRFDHRQPQLRRQNLGSRTFLEKRLADPFDSAPDRWEIDGDLVGKTVPGDGGRADRIPGGRHRMISIRVVTIGVGTIRFATHDER